MLADKDQQTYEVMIVLDVPKPDLSHVFGTAGTGPAAPSAGGRQAAVEAAEQAVSEILRRTGSKEVRRFRNAAGILAVVDASAMDTLAASDHVLEIVENQRLSD